MLVGDDVDQEQVLVARTSEIMGDGLAVTRIQQTLIPPLIELATTTSGDGWQVVYGSVETLMSKQWVCSQGVLRLALFFCETSPTGPHHVESLASGNTEHLLPRQLLWLHGLYKIILSLPASHWVC